MSVCLLPRAKVYQYLQISIFRSFKNLAVIKYFIISGLLTLLRSNSARLSHYQFFYKPYIVIVDENVC